jgi:cellulose synthase/poly-beta-1,6-N-acetylglucosamine synthase-like glycosyltransferase
MTLFLHKNDILDIELYKFLNLDLIELNQQQIMNYWLVNYKNQNKIYNVETFKQKYNHLYPYSNYSTQNIINWIYNERPKSHKVYHIEEVLIDLSFKKPILENGISLIIRAKNEEKNVAICIESVINYVDEIIFVDNNSTDKTFEIINTYASKYDKIKVYQYNIKVNRVGIEHLQALKNNDKNTLGTFYNWCLSKATKKIVFKWDADFICIQHNFKKLVDEYKLQNMTQNIAIWFTGYTLFINNEKYYINTKSFYDEYRIFSYENNFKWYDANLCEYTEPYLKNCSNKYKFIEPLFYEIKSFFLRRQVERVAFLH